MFNLSFGVAVLCFWLIVLLLVIYLMLNNINKLRQDNTALQRSLSSRAIQMERDELRRGRRDSDDEDSDDDDDDYPDGAGGRRTRDLGGGYFAVPAAYGSRGDTPRRSRNDNHWYQDPSEDRSWWDYGPGKGVWNYDRSRTTVGTAESSAARGETTREEEEGERQEEGVEEEEHERDEEEEAKPERHVRREEGHMMMPPDDDEEEEEVIVDEEEENEEEQETQARSVSVSDMVANELLAQGRELRRQAASSSSGPGELLLPGSELVMRKWGLRGIPADMTSYHAWRSDLRCMDFGLEVDLARILHAVDIHLKQLQAMRNPFYHRDFKRVRTTFNYLQDLALLCQRPEPQSYMSAATS